MRRRHRDLDNDTIILKGDNLSKPSSMRLVEDPFAGQYGDGILEPPYDLEFLARLPEYSNILSQCIEAWSRISTALVSHLTR